VNCLKLPKLSEFLRSSGSKFQTVGPAILHDELYRLNAPEKIEYKLSV